jgi:hypothetical protein
MHGRVLTTNSMLKKNWPCNNICWMCQCLHETTDHLLAHCNYVEAVWNRLAPWFGMQSYDLIAEGGPI